MDIKRIVRVQFFVLFTGLLLAAGRISAQEAPEQYRQTWRVGIARFEEQDLLPQYRRFTHQIPASLFETVRRCPSHLLSSEEQRGLREKLKEEERFQLKKELHSLIEQRAAAFLDSGLGERAELAELQADIADKRAEIRHLIRTDLSEWKIDTRPACILAAENDDGKLFSPPRLPLKVWTNEQEIDCLIGGRIEALDDLLYVEMHVYLKDINSSRTLYRGTFFPSEIDQFSGELAAALRSFLYGQEWSDIAFEVEPSTAEIAVDGSDVDTDETGTLRYIDPGIHSIEVRAKGYKSRVLTVETRSEGREAVKVSLEKDDPRTWIVDSEPGGAAVYLNSMQVGTTPLILEDRVGPANLLITKSGYTPRMYVMESADRRLAAQLHPHDVNIDAVVERSRQRFYKGLSAFLLSLPLTVVSYGMSSEYAYAYNSALSNPSAGSDELERLRARSTLWYTAYAGSMLINGMLLTDTFLHMWRYIQNSQEY
ncbi:MAG: PEGA domain-containing protein [Spirochaetia bacterium]